MKKAIRSLFALYVFLLVLFTALIVGVHLIPHDAVAPQVERSLSVFDREGPYPRRTSIEGTSKMDNFTDCYMLNVAYCADSDHPVDAAMRNYRYRGDASMVACMHQLVEGNLLDTKFEYGKYWHGYQVTLRPLLTVTDYSGIRIVNGVSLAIILAVALWLMWHRLSPGATVCFVVSLFMVRSSVLPWSLQYSTCYYVMLLSVIGLLLWPGLSAGALRRAMTFFAIGAVTAFLDFFTAPVMTLGIPLIVMLMRQRRAVAWRDVAGPCVAWLAGYALMWASKWGVAYLLAGYNPLAEVTDSVAIHSVGTDDLGVAQMWLKMAVGWIYPTLPNFLKFAILAVLIMASAMAPRGRGAWRGQVWMLAVAATVLLWVAATTHHSYTHASITSRVYVVCWFAVLCFFYQIIDFKKLKRYVGKP